MVADAPPTTSLEELRRLSCEAFVELFEGTDYLIFGKERLLARRRAPDTLTLSGQRPGGKI
jgi:hypothetical protein